MKEMMMLRVLVLFLCSGLFAHAGVKVHKDSPLINQGKYLMREEPSHRVSDPYTGTAFNPPRNMNAVLIDSSTNGYGMVISTTRPIDYDIEEDYTVISYRQYAGINTTHGQLRIFINKSLS